MGQRHSYTCFAHETDSRRPGGPQKRMKGYTKPREDIICEFPPHHRASFAPQANKHRQARAYSLSQGTPKDGSRGALCSAPLCQKDRTSRCFFVYGREKDYMTIMRHAASPLLSLCLFVPSAHHAFLVAPPLLPAAAPARATTAAASATLRTTMRVCGIESTPNPSSFKFDLDQSLSHHGGSGAAGATKGFTYNSSGGTAGGDQQQAPAPILRVLELQGVESVYALGDWLCVNKKPSAKWDAIVRLSPV